MPKKVDSSQNAHFSNSQYTAVSREAYVPDVDQVADELARKGISREKRQHIFRGVAKGFLGTTSALGVIGATSLGLVLGLGLFTNPIGWAILGAAVFVGIAAGISFAMAGKGSVKDVLKPLLVGAGIGVAVSLIIVIIVGLVLVGGGGGMPSSGGGGGFGGGFSGVYLGFFVSDMINATAPLWNAGIEEIVDSRGPEVKVLRLPRDKLQGIEFVLSKDGGVEQIDEVPNLDELVADINDRNPEEVYNVLRHHYLKRRQENTEFNRTDVVLLAYCVNALEKQKKVEEAVVLYELTSRHLKAVNPDDPLLTELEKLTTTSRKKLVKQAEKVYRNQNRAV